MRLPGEGISPNVVHLASAQASLQQLRFRLASLVVGRRPEPRVPLRTLAWPSSQNLAQSIRRLVEQGGLTIGDTLDPVALAGHAPPRPFTGRGSGSPEFSSEDGMYPLSVGSGNHYGGTLEDPDQADVTDMRLLTDQVHNAVQGLRAVPVTLRPPGLLPFADACLEWFDHFAGLTEPPEVASPDSAGSHD